MNPFDHFDAILRSGNVYARNTGDEVLQGNTPLVLLHCFQVTKLGSVTIWKAEVGKRRLIKLMEKQSTC